MKIDKRILVFLFLFLSIMTFASVNINSSIPALQKTLEVIRNFWAWIKIIGTLASLGYFVFALLQAIIAKDFSQIIQPFFIFVIVLALIWGLEWFVEKMGGTEISREYITKVRVENNLYKQNEIKKLIERQKDE